MATNHNGDSNFMTVLDSQNGDTPKQYPCYNVGGMQTYLMETICDVQHVK